MRLGSDDRHAVRMYSHCERCGRAERYRGGRQHRCRNRRANRSSSQLGDTEDGASVWRRRILVCHAARGHGAGLLLARFLPESTSNCIELCCRALGRSEWSSAANENPRDQPECCCIPPAYPVLTAIGDLGPEAYSFVDWLANAGFRYWQVLPLGPTGYGNSPYQCHSVFAGNPNLISPELLSPRWLMHAVGHWKTREPEFSWDRERSDGWTLAR